MTRSSREHSYWTPSTDGFNRLSEFLDSLPHERWMSRAACIGTNPERWFVSRNKTPMLGICRACPVRAECLDYALSFHRMGSVIHGVWGGTTTAHRRAIIRNEEREADRA